ncbi:AMIN-like domain-containing (lipo)protein [Saccharopolyspora taberi]|uniref:AMIN-like domain-containing protein n=1 Tax=Saccharopolyspora taberi TaxID=60895 RepID=A0ABN3V958_9PSEU
MSVRNKLAIATGSVVLSALALTGCSAGAQPAPPAPAQGNGVQAAVGDTGGAVDTSGRIDIRGGQHGSEERVVFDFSALPELSGGIKVMKSEMDTKSPVWGGSGEPVEGMKGNTFLHVYLEAADAARTTEGPEEFGLPTARSAVVNDNSHGTAELTVGLDAAVDFEVLVEGEKVIINMTRGPLGR